MVTNAACSVVQKKPNCFHKPLVISFCLFLLLHHRVEKAGTRDQQEPHCSAPLSRHTSPEHPLSYSRMLFPEVLSGISMERQTDALSHPLCVLSSHQALAWISQSKCLTVTEQRKSSQGPREPQTALQPECLRGSLSAGKQLCAPETPPDCYRGTCWF